MKKQKYYLAAGALACSAVSGLAMPLANTFAEGTGSQTRDVTVGEVDETVYSVDINWGDMTFDWKYDRATNSFDFKAHHACQAAVYNSNTTDTFVDEAKNIGRLYSDTNCSLLETGELIDSNIYYILEDVPDGQVVVDDYSTNGKVKVSASFTPEDGYSWVTGKFGVWRTAGGGNPPFGDYTEFNEFTNGVFPEDGVIYTGETILGRSFSGHLNLEKNTQTEISTNSISTSDKIGTVTITIEPDLN